MIHIGNGIIVAYISSGWSQWCRPFISLLLQSLSKVTTKVSESHSYWCWSVTDGLWSKATVIFFSFSLYFHITHCLRWAP